MRVAASMWLAVLALVLQRCHSASVHHFRHLAMAEEDEDYRPRFYREYGSVVERSARSEDAFDDYGHLRFGRASDD